MALDLVLHLHAVNFLLVAWSTLASLPIEFGLGKDGSSTSPSSIILKIVSNQSVLMASSRYLLHVEHFFPSVLSDLEGRAVDR